MLETSNEKERHIKWADKLFDMIALDVQELKMISKVTEENIIKWKQWARDKEFIYERTTPQAKLVHKNGRECLGPGCIYCDEEDI